MLQKTRMSEDGTGDCQEDEETVERRMISSFLFFPPFFLFLAPVQGKREGYTEEEADQSLEGRGQLRLLTEACIKALAF